MPHLDPKMSWRKGAKAILQWGAYFANMGLFFFLLPYLDKTLLRARWPRIWRSCQRAVRNALRIFSIEVEVVDRSGGALGSPAIIVANHRSWWDQFALIRIFPQPLHFLAKQAYFKIPVFGRGMKLMEAIPVEEGRLSSESSARLATSLARGESCVFFLEGTRGAGRELLPFRSGAFRAAAESRVPILPVHILGSERVLNKRNSLLSVVRGRMTIVIDPPLMVPLDWEPFKKEFESRFRDEFDQLYRRADERTRSA